MSPPVIMRRTAERFANGFRLGGVASSLAKSNREELPDRPVPRWFAWVDQWVKRLSDIIIAAAALLCLFPLLVLIALLVALDGGPVFFPHRRVGRGYEPFDCLKFRTMMLGADTCLDEYLGYHPHAAAEWMTCQKLSFDPRITSIGRFLRMCSLDELPQLINVLRGEMSLVGPRPITTSELEKYGSQADLYAAVKPGITGAWQIGGRNDLDYSARVEMDSRYAVGRNLRIDFSILLMTPQAILSRRGAK